MSERWTLDGTRSRIEIRTFAEGLLSAAAHDLSLSCEGVEGEGRLDPWIEATLRFPVERLRVSGVLRNGVVDPDSPSGIERREIERRIRTDVFPGAPQLEVVISDEEATLRWQGGRASIRHAATLSVMDETTQRCAGNARVTLSALGVKPVVGPLRAFRVRDAVEIHWNIVIRKSAP